jgi:hypothetical protein
MVEDIVTYEDILDKSKLLIDHALQHEVPCGAWKENTLRFQKGTEEECKAVITEVFSCILFQSRQTAKMCRSLEGFLRKENYSVADYSRYVLRNLE